MKMVSDIIGRGGTAYEGTLGAQTLLGRVGGLCVSNHRKAEVKSNGPFTNIQFRSFLPGRRGGHKRQFRTLGPRRNEAPGIIRRKKSWSWR